MTEIDMKWNKLTETYHLYGGYISPRYSEIKTWGLIPSWFAHTTPVPIIPKKSYKKHQWEENRKIENRKIENSKIEKLKTES